MKSSAFSWDLLHPMAISAFEGLASDLSEGYRLHMTGTEFRPFEGLRSPSDQQMRLVQASSKVGAWHSAHQYGMAVDFVPFTPLGWSWDEDHDWSFLSRCASGRGLICDRPWDRPHVEHPAFRKIQHLLFPPSLAANAAKGRMELRP